MDVMIDIAVDWHLVSKRKNTLHLDT